MSEEIISAIIGAIATLLGTWLAFRWSKSRDSRYKDLEISSSKEALSKRQHEYDVFVSAPIAGFADDASLAAAHARIVPIVSYLEEQIGFKVYWAGRNIGSKHDFDAKDISAKRDVEALLNSKFFLLLYPEKIVSSVLFEAGIALRGSLSSVYFVSDRNHLPFLMSEASQAFKNVRTCEGSLPDGLLSLLKRHGREFFEQTFSPSSECRSTSRSS